MPNQILSRCTLGEAHIKMHGYGAKITSLLCSWLLANVIGSDVC